MSGFLPGQLLRAQQLNEAIDNGGIVRSVAGRTGNVTLSSDDVLGAAPIASPLFTGEPRGPTAAPDTNTIQLATTAFVLAQAAATNPVMNGTAGPGSGTRFSRADHVHPSDTSRVAKIGDTMAGALLLTAGAAATPGLAFTGDATTGLYSSATGTVNVATAGTNRLGINATSLTPTVPIYAPAGSAAAPAYAFGANADMGLYRAASNQLGVAVAGAQMLLMTTLDHTLSTRNTTLQEASANSGVLLRLSTAGGSSGTSGALAYMRGSETRWWIYRTNDATDVDDGSNTGSDLYFRSWTDAGAALRDQLMLIRSTGQVRFPTTGTASAPTIGFGSTGNQGISYSAANTIDFVTNGVARVTLNTETFTTAVPIVSSHNSATGNTFTQNGTGVALTIQNNGTGNSLVVNDAGSDTTPFVIDAAGKVGVGVPAPTVELDVLGAGQFTGNVTAPTAPSANGHLTNKLYVDNAVASISPVASLRNQVINGDFYIHQRGTGAITSNGFAADRWRNSSVGGAHTFQRVLLTDADRAAIGRDNARYALKYAVTGGSAAGDYDAIVHRMEGVAVLAGRTITVSWWARRTAGAGNMAIELEQINGTGGSPSPSVTQIGAQAQTLTTSWQKFTRTVAVPSISGKTLGTNNDDTFSLNFWLSAGSTSAVRASSLGVQTITVQIADVMVEIGSAATPFEVRPRAVEQALCDRYYQTIEELSILRCAVGSYGGGVTSAVLRTRMRRAPTVALTFLAGTVNNPETASTSTLVKVWFTNDGNLGDYSDYTVALDAEFP